jgi:hypothetical protein
MSIIPPAQKVVKPSCRLFLLVFDRDLSLGSSDLRSQLNRQLPNRPGDPNLTSAWPAFNFIITEERLSLAADSIFRKSRTEKAPE